MTSIPVGIYTPMLQLRPKSVVIYDRYEGPQSLMLKIFRRQNMKLQRKGRYKGKMSDGTKKRLTKAVNLLIQCAKPAFIWNEVSERIVLHKLSFITLTVSDPDKKLTGKEAYEKLLSHFLAWLRRTKACHTYIWKAEHQRNGQIHYHITTPSFINYQEIRDKWNNLQRKAGLLESYAKAKGHYNANSTDVHEVSKINDLSAYLLKYITKSYQNEKDLGGKVWDCSQNLKANNYFTVELSDEQLSFLRCAVDEELATDFTGNRYKVVKFKEPPAEHLLTALQFANYTTYFNVIRAMRAKEKPPPKEKKEAAK